MDEFCANKDSQLKRCACSSRVNEFDSTKKRLANVEEKMLDFNQRLLTVNMDKEDAAALNQATEGETAFLQKDTSKSKQMLDDISKKLNASFNDTNFNQSMTSISLSLDTDSAFDTVDSLQAASTTAKTGTALYSAALPICREMAAEVCSDDELSLAESGYQMVIEQDCNAVQKSYQTQVDQARDKVREGSALLDMSRLDVYQERNSDDILTCKQKMLTMLTDSTVCGDGLGKCLDTTGQYIDPSTGEALLSDKLVNLASLIMRPSADQAWTSVPANQVFVTYLNSKKTFLAPAMENCQDIADAVWDAFIEDALAQIKLAQTKKLEDVRQSCTTLTTQCLADTAKTIQDFDARALSTFGVLADKTVNEMCASIKNACTAVLNYSVTGDETTDSDWATGMGEIATDKTYDTLMQTCREVGRACIIQACKSVSGNFGLCEDIQTSVNRKSIINRTACWDEVQKCIEQTGIATINKIFPRKTDVFNATDTDTANGNYSFYANVYDSNSISAPCTADTADTNDTATKASKECGIHNLCSEKCDTESGTYDKNACQVCRLTERVWGNCEFKPDTNLKETYSHNYIKTHFKNSDDETLLSWFAKNTNTDSSPEACRDTSCGAGKKPYIGTDGTVMCVDAANLTDDGEFCPPDSFWRLNVATTRNVTEQTITNCCKDSNGTSGTKDAFGNCCLSGRTSTLHGFKSSIDNTKGGFGSIQANNTHDFLRGEGATGNEDATGACLPETAFLVAQFPVADQSIASTPSNMYVICVPDDSKSASKLVSDNSSTTYPEGKTLKCDDGHYVFVLQSEKAKTNNNAALNGRYIIPEYKKSNEGHNAGDILEQSYIVNQVPYYLDYAKTKYNATPTWSGIGDNANDLYRATGQPWEVIINKKDLTQ